MFAAACAKAMGYTKPLISCFLTLGGTPNAGNGSLVIVNRDGWFLTAAHLFSMFVKQQADMKAVQQHAAEAAAIENDERLEAKQKRRRLAKLQRDDQWITGTSFWWAPSLNEQPRPLVTKMLKLIADHDLALGQIADFDPSWLPEPPAFKAAPPLRPGTSLCRLGFPFTSTQISVDHGTREISVDVSNLSFFPNDGILTREVVLKRDAAGNAVRGVETSTPGLRGQSGGPIFDRNGTVWSIQSMTGHLSLGFDPPDPGNRNRTVHQFMNVGIGIHPESIIGALEANQIAFRKEGE